MFLFILNEILSRLSTIATVFVMYTVTHEELMSLSYLTKSILNGVSVTPTI